MQARVQIKKISPIDSARRGLQNDYHIIEFWGGGLTIGRVAKVTDFQFIVRGFESRFKIKVVLKNLREDYFEKIRS